VNEQVAAPDEMVLKVLDFDPALPCEAVELTTGRPACGERAAWVFRCKTCRASNLACHTHKALQIAQSIAWGATQCQHCRAAAIRLDDLMDILPIGSAL
jgi:hypothetical protein